MNQIWSILTIGYEFGIVPLLLGLIWLEKSEPAGFAKLYSRGYFTMLALFEVVAVPMVYAKRTLSELAEIWRGICFAAIPVVLLLLCLKRKILAKKCRELFKNGKVIREQLFGLFIICFVAMLLSAVFVLPSEQDDTAETAAIAIDSDTMYVYETYTKNLLPAIPEEKGKSPVDLLYAVGALNSGMDATFLIHLMLPFFLIPFFYAVSWETSGYFYKSSLKKRQLFVIFLMIFYSAACYTRAIPAMGAFQNIWNAASLFVCCGIPAVLYQCFEILDFPEQKSILSWIRISWKKLLLLAVTVTAGQLMLARGMMLSVLAVFACIGIFLFRNIMKIGTVKAAFGKKVGKIICLLPQIFGILMLLLIVTAYFRGNMKTSWLDFGQDTVNITLLFLAVIWIFLYEKEKRQNNLYLYSILSIGMILLLQMVSLLLLHRDMMPKTYYLIPYGMLLAYVGVEASEQLILRKNKWIIVVLYAIIIQAGIGLEYEESYLLGNYNDRKVSSTVMRMAECIQSIDGIKDPYLLAPEEIASQIQECDVKIKVAYGATYNYPEDNVELLLSLMKEYGSNCLIVKEAYDEEEYIKSKGYRLVIIFDGYSLYYKK